MEMRRPLGEDRTGQREAQKVREASTRPTAFELGGAWGSGVWGHRHVEPREPHPRMSKPPRCKGSARLS